MAIGGETMTKPALEAVEQRFLAEYARQAGRMACTGTVGPAAIKRKAIRFMAHSRLLRPHISHQDITPAVLHYFLEGWRQQEQEQARAAPEQPNGS